MRQFDNFLSADDVVRCQVELEIKMKLGDYKLSLFLRLMIKSILWP